MEIIEINIPGFTIAGKTWGNKTNPPILALHGWLDNANSFEPIADYLKESYYFIAIDLPGHGFSSHLPEGMHYHFIDGLFTTIQIIKALKFPKVHLLGHSLGACIVSLVAGIAPNYLLSLSLIEGLGPLTQSPESSAIQLIHYIDHLSFANRQAKGYKDQESAALVRAKKGYVSLEIAKKLCERGLEEKNGLYYWCHDLRLQAPSPLQMTEIQVLSCLKEIRANTLLILADNGFSFNSKLMEQRIQRVKNLNIRYLNGGHHIHMEQPHSVANTLLNFLENC